MVKREDTFEYRVVTSNAVKVFSTLKEARAYRNRLNKVSIKSKIIYRVCSDILLDY